MAGRVDSSSAGLRVYRLPRPTRSTAIACWRDRVSELRESGDELKVTSRFAIAAAPWAVGEIYRLGNEKTGNKKARLHARLNSHSTHTLSAKRTQVKAAGQVSWLPGSSSSRLPSPRASDSRTFEDGGDYRLQWRDRAGLTPASLSAPYGATTQLQILRFLKVHP